VSGLLTLIFYETKEVLKDKSFYLWALFLPVLFLLVFSNIGKGKVESKPLLNVVAVENSIQVKKFLSLLERDFKIVESDEKNNDKLSLVIPHPLYVKGKKSSFLLFIPENISSERTFF